MRVLYVEDEKYLADAIIHLLKKANIAVDWASDGESGLELASQGNYDCIILDIILPKLSGIDILRNLRAQKNSTPVIMLSALAEVEDKVKALDIGADDYLAKPFKATELIARLKALVRRPPLQANHDLKFGDLVYHLDERSLNGLDLTPKEAELIEVLLRYPDKTHPKSQLLNRVWGQDTTATENYVEVYISYLRKKLKKLHLHVKIKTVRDLGYRLEYTG